MHLFLICTSFLFMTAACDPKGKIIHKEVKPIRDGHVLFEFPLTESRKEHRVYLNVDYRYSGSNQYSMEIRLATPHDETTFQVLTEKQTDITEKQPGSSLVRRTRKEGKDEHRVFSFIPRETGTYLVEGYQDMAITGAILDKAELEIRH